jgi:CheY-like chemotaxis protein
LPKELLFFLVDDDLDDQEIFLSALKDVDSKIQCKTAENGCEALQLFKDENFIPDFIFLDLNMPKVNGKECLTELRKINRLKKTPIYIYTTSSAQKDKLEAKKFGATGFITKPTLINILIKTLSEIVSNAYKGA